AAPAAGSNAAGRAREAQSRARSRRFGARDEAASLPGATQRHAALMSSDDGSPDPAAEAPQLVSAAPTYMPIRQLNGHKANAADEVEPESELSEPDSTVPSPSRVGLTELEGEIVVDAQANRGQRPQPLGTQDPAMQGVPDESAVSHYPKRKRTSLYDDLSETKMEISQSAAPEEKTPPYAADSKSKPNRQSMPGGKGVLLGNWRDSNVPDQSRKHAVVGFIDVRDRLRTRIQPQTKEGESLADEYPLPPGPGGSWVTFERVVFSDHLVGLDHFQIKEYVRLRTLTTPEGTFVLHEDTEEERKAAEGEAVKEAIRRVKNNPALENPVVAPAIAYGVDVPDHLAVPNRPDVKRRKVSGSFAAINSAAGEAPAAGADASNAQTPPQPMAAHQTRFSVDPLPGTRPTRILIGYWKPSSEVDPRDRHAVYGILGQNDMFRVKVVRETRDGRFVDGNFPSGAGALWIAYEEVEFEDHLKALNRQEIKEYCRIRQYQQDHGEDEAERIENETRAVYEAQTRAGTVLRQPNNAALPTFSVTPPVDVDMDRPNPRAGHGGHELRQSRRIEPRPDGRTLRQSLNENELRSGQRVQSVDAAERTSALARREIARAEAAQGRADRHAINRERAAAAAADAATAAAAAAAAATPTPPTNGRRMFHETDDMQRLNKVWARQESLRLKAASEDAKIYDGVKYERKSTGPFIGKLVSQGTIINIDGEDYVEYRVLTKPSFF
ncbi:Uncharacterized protein TCAP_04848, partial [Tolypocladium capitatum]